MTKAIPTSFDFGGAIRPDYVIKCSYGNDSIALLRWVYEYQLRFGPLGRVVVLYNETKFGSAWWPGRVLNGEALAGRYGFIPCRTDSKGMMKLIKERNTWPDSQMRFCTQELKIIPTLSWLAEHDPEGKATMVCGVRREESDARALWPEWETADEGRQQWSPMVFLTAQDRNALIERAGWKPLPHRSRECKCILGNATDIKSWSEDDIAAIEAMELELGKQQHGPNRFMFRPHSKKGSPEGIRAVVKWANGVKTKEQPTSGCDSGYCTG